MSLVAGIPTPPLSKDEESERKDYIDVGSSKATGGPYAYSNRTPTAERKMGPTELSYFLPARQSGVNDMYLHLGFRAREELVKRARVRAVWAILRLRHPLLSARAQMYDYDDVRFIHTAPSSVEDALLDADMNLEFRKQSKDELIDSYLNGPRTLSNDRLSYLVVAQPRDQSNMPTPPSTPSLRDKIEIQHIEDSGQTHEGEQEYELLICAMHFLGDGMALHQFANDFFGLLGSEKSEFELADMVNQEWTGRWGITNANTSILPPALEENMPIKRSKFRQVAAKVDFQLSEDQLIGGQAFPRRKHPERHTIVPTLSFPEEHTKVMLKKCKSRGVSISAALFALCNVAWARMGGGNAELPMMMYSALNLRPYFTVKQPSPWDSYWFLAIGYFNVILPSFLPKSGDTEATFWYRARQAKEQSTRAAKSPLVVSRTHEMARERGSRARGWAKEDDEKEAGTWVAPTPSPPQSHEPLLPARAKSPSSALIGLSLLGNLDGIYKHAAFPSIHLHTLTTGSRQRHGAMLLFGYTFVGKLWISLGYDQNGFEEGVVDKFWRELCNGVEEFLG